MSLHFKWVPHCGSCHKTPFAQKTFCGRANCLWLPVPKHSMDHSRVTQESNKLQKHHGPGEFSLDGGFTASQKYMQGICRSSSYVTGCNIYSYCQKKRLIKFSQWPTSGIKWDPQMLWRPPGWAN